MFILISIGYIVCKIFRSADIPDCGEALYCNFDASGYWLDNDGFQRKLSLLSCKKYWNLLIPSTSVFKIVWFTDRLLRQELCSWTSFNKSTRLKVISNVLQQSRGNYSHQFKSIKWKVTSQTATSEMIISHSSSNLFYPIIIQLTDQVLPSVNRFLSPKICGYQQGYNTQHALLKLLETSKKA